MNTINNIVISSIQSTINNLNGYWNATVESRLDNKESRMGSYYPGKTTIKEVEDLLLNANWVKDPDQHWALEGTTIYEAEIPGMTGIIDLKDLPEGASIELQDPKNTGFVKPVIRGQEYVPTNFTHLIVGPENGEDVVYTFFPGIVIKEPQIRGINGSVITREEAITLGFTHANIAPPLE